MYAISDPASTLQFDYTTYEKNRTVLTVAFSINISSKSDSNALILRVFGKNSQALRFMISIENSVKLKFESSSSYLSINMAEVLKNPTGYSRFSIAYTDLKSTNLGFARIMSEGNLVFSGLMNQRGTPLVNSYDNEYTVILGGDGSFGSMGFVGKINFFHIANYFYSGNAYDGYDYELYNCYHPLGKDLCLVCNQGFDYSLQSDDCLPYAAGDHRVYLPNAFFRSNNFICEKYYFLDDFGDCEYCNIIGCDYCYNERSCKNCSENYYFLNNSCYLQCPTGYYSNSTTMTCLPCDRSCYSCSSNATDCLVCAQTYLSRPYRSYCVRKCEDGFYQKDSSSCAECHPNCATCFGNTYQTCITCSPTTWLLSQGVCVTNCPDGYYSNYGDRSCKPCNKMCSTCFMGGTYGCLTCASSLMYLYKGTCILCDNSCNGCKGTNANDCISCKAKSTLQNGACIPIVCSKGYYPGESSCEKCPNICTECESADVCTACTSGYLQVKTSCKPCSAVTGYQNVPGECVEVCGDGLKMGLLECDDGNKVDGDGCSSTCAVEAGWTCAGGTSTKPDKCTLSAKTSIEGKTSGGSLAVKFSSDVTIIGDMHDAIAILTIPDLQIVSNCYKITKKTESEYSLNFDGCSEIKSVQTLELRVKKPKNILDFEKNPVFFKAFQFTVTKTKYSDQAQQVSTAGSAVFGLTFGLILATGGASLMWNLLNSLQSLTYLKYISMDFPDFLGLIMNFSKFAQLKWFPNVVEILFFNIDPEQYSQESNAKFKEEKYSATFLLNSGSTITLILLLFAGKALTGYLSRAFKLPFHDMIVESTRIQTIFEVYFNLYFIMLIGALLQIQTSSFDNGFVGTSTICAYFSMFIFVLSPLLILKYSLADRNIDNQRMRSKLEVIIKEYDTSKFFGRNFIIFELVDKIIYAAGLTLMYRNPYSQMAFILFGKIGLVLLMAKIQPFKDKKKFFHRISTEVLVCITVINFMIMKKTDYNSASILSSTGFVISMITLNIFMIVYHEYTILKRAYRNYKKNSKKNNRKKKLKIQMTKYQSRKQKINVGSKYTMNGRGLIALTKGK